MNKTKYLLQIIFTLSYGIIMVPFTASFFRSIVATPPAIEGAYYLNAAQPYALPAFLLCLEFISIQLSLSYWRNPTLKILTLFLCCQLFAGFAVFYDVTNSDFLKYKDEFEYTRTQKSNAIKTIIVSLNKELGDASVDIERVNEQRVRLRESQNHFLQINRRTPRQSVEARIAAANTASEELGTLGSEYASLIKNKAVIEGQRKQEYADLKIVEAEPFAYKTEMDYMIYQAFSPRSLLAAFIAAIFPISILGAAFVMQKYTGSGNVNSFNLDDSLELAGNLPEDIHVQYTKLLVPAVAAQMSGRAASQAIERENRNLNVAYAQIKEFLKDAKSLQEKTAKSALEEGAKSYLVNEIEKIMNSKLTEVCHA